MILTLYKSPSSRRVAEPEAERLRSEVSRGPNARAGAQAGAREAVVTLQVKRELQAEAEQLRIDLLRLRNDQSVKPGSIN